MSGRKKARARKPAKPRASSPKKVFVEVTMDGNIGRITALGMVTPADLARLREAAVALEKRIPGATCEVEADERRLDSGGGLLWTIENVKPHDLVARRVGS